MWEAPMRKRLFGFDDVFFSEPFIDGMSTQELLRDREKREADVKEERERTSGQFRRTGKPNVCVVE